METSHIHLLFKSSKGVISPLGYLRYLPVQYVCCLRPLSRSCSLCPFSSKWKLIFSHLFFPLGQGHDIVLCPLWKRTGILEALQNNYQVQTHPQLRSTAFGTCIDWEGGPFRWMGNWFLDEEGSEKYLSGLAVPAGTFCVPQSHITGQHRPLAVIWSLSCDEHHPYGRDESTQNSTSETALGLWGGHLPKWHFSPMKLFCSSFFEGGKRR